MLHIYYELTLKQLDALTNTEFLTLCSQYLDIAIEYDRILEIDRLAREYGAQYLKIPDNHLPPLS